MQTPQIGWIGTGVMGLSMCAHILEAGYPVCIFTRTKEKAANLLDQGATWCSSPAQVAKSGDIIFTMVGFPQDVEQTFFTEQGLIHNSRPGTTLVDMTTSKPSLAQSIYEQAREKGIFALDAPVSGGDLGAREGKLAIMVGGDRENYDQVLPLFKLMGENIAYMGQAGSGQHTKMSNQILIASTMVGVVESLLYAQRAGLSAEKVIDIIGQGAASSWSINNLGRRIVKGDYNPGFYIKHFIKDMGVALEEAEKMQLSLPGLALAKQLYIYASAQGMENLGTQGLYKVFAKMNAQKC
jgi:3-hydroxyisobutyrate dehydrogenase